MSRFIKSWLSRPNPDVPDLIDEKPHSGSPRPISIGTSRKETSSRNPKKPKGTVLENNVGKLKNLIRKGQVDKVRKLLQSNPTLAQAQEPYPPPLHACAVSGQASYHSGEIATLLLKAGAMPSSCGPKLETALHKAAFHGATEVLNAILSFFGEESATSAAATSMRGSSKNTMLAALVHARDTSGATALHHAARWGHIQIVKALLRVDADPNAKNHSGSTPLHMASGSGNSTLCQLLIRHGADPSVRNERGLVAHASNSPYIPSSVAEGSGGDCSESEGSPATSGNESPGSASNEEGRAGRRGSVHRKGVRVGRSISDAAAAMKMMEGDSSNLSIEDRRKAALRKGKEAVELMNSKLTLLKEEVERAEKAAAEKKASPSRATPRRTKLADPKADFAVVSAEGHAVSSADDLPKVSQPASQSKASGQEKEKADVDLMCGMGGLRLSVVPSAAADADGYDEQEDSEESSSTSSQKVHTFDDLDHQSSLAAGKSGEERTLRSHGEDSNSDGDSVDEFAGSEDDQEEQGCTSYQGTADPMDLYHSTLSVGLRNSISSGIEGYGTGNSEDSSALSAGYIPNDMDITALGGYRQPGDPTSDEEESVATQEHGVAATTTEVLKPQCKKPVEQESVSTAADRAEQEFTEWTGVTNDLDGMVHDWNSRFQNVTSLRHEEDLNTPEDERARVNQALLKLSRDFVFCAKGYGKIIISELWLPDFRKTIKPTTSIAGVAGGEKYLVDNILFKFAVDKEGLYGGNDSLAMKVAGHELKSLVCLHNCHVPDVCLPMMCLVDYRGYRLAAVARLPVSRKTLVLGCDNASEKQKAVVKNDEALNEHLKVVGLKLNLAKHMVGFRHDQKYELHTPLDLEGHRGEDGRFYVLDVSRLMPPTPPSNERRLAYLWELFRPEYVKSFMVPLCNDSFSNFVLLDPKRRQHERNLKLAFSLLITKVIPNFVKHSYSTSLRELIAQGEDLSKFRLSQAMHRHGINARYLGHVLKHVPSTLQGGRLLVILEGLARVCKNNIRRRLRNTMRHLKVPLEQPYRDVVVGMLNLIFGDSPAADRYDGILKNQLKMNFGMVLTAQEIRTPFRVAMMSVDALDGRWYVFSRLQAMMGFRFSRRTVRRFRRTDGESEIFASDYPLDDTDLEEIGERVKHVGFVAAAEGRNFYHKGLLAMRTDPKSCPHYFDLALRKYEEAFDSNPSSQELLMYCATASERKLKMSGDRENYTRGYDLSDPKAQRVQKYLKSAIALDAKSCLALLEYAKFLDKAGKRKEAEHHYLLALEADPSFARAHSEYCAMLFDYSTKISTDRKMLEYLQGEFGEIGGRLKSLHEQIRRLVRRARQLGLSVDSILANDAMKYT